MNRWQKIGVGISVLWLIGLPIFFIVRSGGLKTVGHALIAGNSDTAALWTMMLGPVVLLWAVGTLTLNAVRWIRRTRKRPQPLTGQGQLSRDVSGHACRIGVANFGVAPMR